jgi:hypothetical protein
MSDRRFYDGDRTVSEAIQITGQLPSEIQEVIAAGFSFLAIRDHQADRRLDNLKAIYSEPVFPPHTSRNNRRDYDQVSEFQVALDYLQVLEADERQNVSQQILALAKFARDYLDKCKFMALLPSKQKLVKVRDAYLQLETQKAALYLDTIQREFKASLISFETSLHRQSSISEGNTIHLGAF